MSKLLFCIASKISSSDYYIVDSMPLEICKLIRSGHSKICKENFETSPNKGYCATQKMSYYGYKLHAVCNIDGVFTDFDLTKASVHDIHYLKDIKRSLNQCVVLADKAYLSKEYQLDLFYSSQIKLEVPMRSNQYEYKKQDFILT